MSSVKLSLFALPLMAGFAIAGCASAPTGQEADAQSEAEALLAEALKPASAEEIAIANRADPLTKANFWAGEYRKDPTQLETAIAFATALRGIGTHDRAAEVAAQSSVLHPESVELMMVLGRASLSNGNINGAAKAFHRATMIAPQRADVWAALGSTLDRLELHQDAQKAYQQALAIEPARTNTLANYGLSLALTGDIEAAEEKLRRASSNPDAGPKVHENLALILGLQGKYDAMREVSGRSAPEDVINNNIAVLKTMQQPLRSWSELVDEVENAPVPKAEMLAEIPKQVSSTAVGEEPVADVTAEAAPATSAPITDRPATGRGPLRLRGSIE